ncbi:hypothetical protein D9758_011024 [Tetrapyrgos nigripes]|uniref:non-specific serine/threonine protein kinase n=1 Tax=Tetrapyrgos nigripes TaxID=182062 RepID=A0A8H5GHG1_9AGAR|nr:hypothetical protein D9758_011024 [Tetrapyrgos nigripes]
MYALRVNFPQNWPGWHVSEYILNESLDKESFSLSQDENTPALINATVDSEMHSDYCSDSPVFRGFIRDADCTKLLESDSYWLPKTNPTSASSSPLSSPAAISVVLKFAMREDLVEDLAQEAAVYFGPLKSLQGKSIPRCFGFYTGAGVEGQEIACLVLECWGEVLSEPFAMLSLDVRILERLREMHRCGLHHGDFAERNVLMYNNDIRFIDFDQVEGHECDCDTKLDSDDGVGLPPDLDKVGCPLLYLIGWEMGIWDDSDVDESDLSSNGSGSLSGSGFGSSESSLHWVSSKEDLVGDLDARLARDLSLDDGREG